MAETKLTGLIAGESLQPLMWAAVTLLAEGEPVEVARLAAEAGWPVERMQAALGAFPGVDWDDRGRVAGLGLTLRPTQHRFEVGGHILFTWCAMDTLVFPLLLGRAAHVESACPATGQTISLTAAPEGISGLSPSAAVVSQTSLDGPVGEIRTAVCDHGHFFASAAAAGEWQARHPSGKVRPVAEAFEVARDWHEQGRWIEGVLPC